MQGESARLSVLQNMQSFWGKTIAPHVFRSAASLSAHLHLLASIPNALICEYQQIANPLREALFVEPLVIKDGYITVSRHSWSGYIYK